MKLTAPATMSVTTSAENRMSSRFEVISVSSRARVASHAAHPFTRSLPHVPPFRVSVGIGSHGPAWSFPERSSERAGQRPAASVVRAALGLHDARVSRVRDAGGITGAKRSLDRLLVGGGRPAQTGAERSAD